ncbi:LOW QUALITY PROTEIN: tensin-3-like [Neosynchiropus ocellatus]
MEAAARQPHLTYVSERVITVFSEGGGQRSLRDVLLMLRSKHGSNFMLVNVARRHEASRRADHQVLDTGWVDLLAPGLDQILGVCRLMESWLQSHPRHVLVLHCEGGRGLCGVAVASYLCFSGTSASAELSLDRYAMRRFYHDKLSADMTPSQRRYVRMLDGVLTGTLRMSPVPTFLLCVALHGLPKIRPDGGESRRPPPPHVSRPSLASPACSLFLRVYQGLRPACTSAVHHVSAGETDRLFVVLQPAQLLQGDVLVVCYETNGWLRRRQVLFRLQVHTGLLAGHQVTFSKSDLDCACDDPRFPADSKVQLLFSDSPEEGAGRQLWRNSSAVTVDYDTLDPLVRRDSYQDSSPGAGEAAHVPDRPHGGVYASVRKRSGGEGPAGSPPGLVERSPSASSDSGLSVGSQGCSSARPRPGQEEGAPAGRQVSGPQVAQPLLDIMAELAAAGRGEVLTTDAFTRELWSGETELPEDRVDASEPGPVAHDVRSGGTPGAVRDAPPPDLSALTTDVDESIEQLNQLILDLDPTFVPVPTRCSPLSRSASVRTIGASPRSGWKQQKQLSDVTGCAGWPGGGALSFSSPAPSSQQRVEDPGHTHGSEAVPSTPAFPVTPPTPYVRSFSLQPLDEPPERHAATPDRMPGIPPSDRTGPPNVTPARLKVEMSLWGSGSDWTCMVKTSRASPAPDRPESRELTRTAVTYAGVSGFIGPDWLEALCVRSPGVQPHTCLDQTLLTACFDSPDARSFLASAARGDADGEMLRPRVSGRRLFSPGLSPGGPAPHPDSVTPPPVWLDSLTSSAPPSGLDTPEAHSSPVGGPEVGRDSSDFSRLFANGSLEHSLLEGLGGLGVLGPDRPPLLPQKRRGADGPELGSLSGLSSPRSGSSISLPFTASTPEPPGWLAGTPTPAADLGGRQDTAKFVQDTSRFWYKPDISRDQAIAALKDKDPGSFVVRDSHSFRGAYGLAMKVATPPPSVVQQGKTGDLASELVRHFLIECSAKGVRLKGCPDEPYFGSLTALVCQHSITALALPCTLILPDRDALEDSEESPAQTTTNSAAELLKQGAACNVWFLGSVELESLTGHQAVQKAATLTLTMDPPPPSTVVHFKVSAQGVTLTDNQRKLFFRRHYAVNTVIFCSLDPQGRKWRRGGSATAKIFGFVARKSQSETENVCHLFAEHDPEQPASAIVNFVSKVMIGSHKK